MLSKLELKVILRRCAFNGARSQCQFEVRGKSFFSSSSPVGDDRVVQVELKGERRSREREREREREGFSFRAEEGWCLRS